MTLVEFVTALRGLGYPVAHSHFRVDGNNSAPLPPFITYTTPSTDNFIADNRVYHRIQDINVELYTYHKDLEIEGLIEQMFDDMEIVYDAIQIWIEKEEVLQTLYEVRMI